MRGGWVAASSGALALLAGCSGNPGGAGADAHPGGEPASSSSASPTVTAELGPLALALGYEVWNPEARDYLAELTAEQDVIAACMREAGFEYWPHVPTIEGILVWDGPPRGTLEVAVQYGYGVWRSVGDGISATYPDPPPEREEYLRTLSRAAAQAYESALYGEFVEVFPDGSYSTTGGCEARAREQAAQPPIEDPDVLAARDFVASIGSHADVEDLNLEWSLCMAEAGLVFASPAEPEVALRERRAGVLARAGGEWPPPAVVIAESELEVATALADVECRGRLGYDERFRVIRDRLERAYLDAHPELIARVEAGSVQDG